MNHNTISILFATENSDSYLPEKIMVNFGYSIPYSITLSKLLFLNVSGYVRVPGLLSQ